MPPSLQEARRRWAELLRRIFEVEPPEPPTSVDCHPTDLLHLSHP